MVQLFAVTRVRYGRRDVQPGEPFEASDKDAKVLVAVRKATRAPASAPSDLPKAAMVPIEPVTPEPEPEPTPEPEATDTAPLVEPEEVREPPTYARRDMQAETGQTGADKQSRSSRQAHRRGKRT